MDAISLLTDRRSTPPDRLNEPAPNGADLETILRSAVAAPDHGALTPWRFILIRGEARRRLGEVFADATQARDPTADAEALSKQAGKPLRAPLIIAVVARIDEDNPKIPVIEQLLSAGAAAQQIQLAAIALGYGAIWLTGANAHDATVAEALGLELEDRIVAFVHLGTPSQEKAAPQRPDPWAFTTEWVEPFSHDTL